MVCIEKNSLTITIAGNFMEETYVELLAQLLRLLRSADPDLCNSSSDVYLVYELLEAMLPDHKQACSMSVKK